jgi:hypothetical protein
MRHGERGQPPFFLRRRRSLCGVGAGHQRFDPAADEFAMQALELAQVGGAHRAMQAAVEHDHAETLRRALRKVEDAAVQQPQSQRRHRLPRHQPSGRAGL